MKFDFRQLTSHFQLYGNFVVAVPYGTGHINDTFQVTFDQGGTLLHYIIQRVNTNVFKAPEELMDNFLRVTRHIGAKIRDERAAAPATRRRTLEVVNSIYGKPYWRDRRGISSAAMCLWRMRARTTSLKRRLRLIRRRRRSATSRRTSRTCRSG